MDLLTSSVTSNSFLSSLSVFNSPATLPDIIKLTNASEEKLPVIQPEDVLQAQSGDAAAYERLYHAHRQKVFQLCLRVTRNAADAEDLTQQVFLQAFLHLSSLRSNCTFRAWLSRIAINESLMHLRKQHNPCVSIEGLQEVSCDVSINRCSWSSRGLNRILINQVIRKLPMHFQTMILLRHLAGYTQQEITEWLGIPLGTTKARLSRARRTLRQALAD